MACPALRLRLRALERRRGIRPAGVLSGRWAPTTLEPGHRAQGTEGVSTGEENAVSGEDRPGSAKGPLPPLPNPDAPKRSPRWRRAMRRERKVGICSPCVCKSALRVPRSLQGGTHLKEQVQHDQRLDETIYVLRLCQPYDIEKERHAAQTRELTRCATALAFRVEMPQLWMECERDVRLATDHSCRFCQLSRYRTGRAGSCRWARRMGRCRTRVTASRQQHGRSPKRIRESLSGGGRGSRGPALG